MPPNFSLLQAAPPPTARCGGILSGRCGLSRQDECHSRPRPSGLGSFSCWTSDHLGHCREVGDERAPGRSLCLDRRFSGSCALPAANDPAPTGRLRKPSSRSRSRTFGRRELLAMGRRSGQARREHRFARLGLASHPVHPLQRKSARRLWPCRLLKEKQKRSVRYLFA